MIISCISKFSATSYSLGSKVGYLELVILISIFLVLDSPNLVFL
jgi:hypothetical protein